MGKPSGRIYWRERSGGKRRAYGDFRDYSDVGGGREALKPPGSGRATTDPDLATQLVADRLKELEQRRRDNVLGIDREATLADYAKHHLIEKKRAGKVSDGHIEDSERFLTSAVEFFGAGRRVAGIGVRDVQRWAAHLQKQPNQRGGTLSDGTVRHYINALSNLYRRAASEGQVPPGQNPVAAMLDKPTATPAEAEWLEVHEAALLLEAARSRDPKREDMATPLRTILATFLLTGGRKSEVLGLQVGDISFDRQTVTFRPNDHRDLKTRTSHRTVPLWPQLERVLRPYVFGGEAPASGLLFPSRHRRVRGEGQQMIRDLRRPMDAVAERAGWNEGDIRTKMFRHTYCAARLQTLDNGHPVAIYTVAKEMGHGGDSLVKRVYGHLGNVRHRSEVVEYRAEQHADTLGERLTAVRAGAAD